MTNYKTALENLLNSIDINLDGNRKWDITIHDQKAYRRILQEPSLGAGESYMDRWWDCVQLDEFFFRVTRHLDLNKIYNSSTLLKFFIKNFFYNQQSMFKSKKVAQTHYDLGNDLYQRMLGRTMAYTCGYWKHATSLDDAQLAKYELICQKLHLHPGERLLELGCGWGGFAHYAATHYGVHVTAINISKEQMKFAQAHRDGLAIEYITSDYRNIKKYNPKNIKFDKIASIGMCEHVGHRNYNKFLHIARQQLKNDGLCLIHTIGKNITFNFTDPWVQKYIFPSGMLPSIKQIARAGEKHFILEDLHNFGADYDKTLMAWFDNFDTHWPELKEKYGERFYRMWKYYLLSCAGAFRSRSMQLWQFVFSPLGTLNGYNSIR